ncbi:hypothetical protein SAMN05216316_0500 [Nitrosovibrio sp. Nv6]|nr:hypothetical protein SAMN05216316_0500 [Nitrosovibrio sp. Nv6]
MHNASHVSVLSHNTSRVARQNGSSLQIGNRGTIAPACALQPLRDSRTPSAPDARSCHVQRLSNFPGSCEVPLFEWFLFPFTFTSPVLAAAMVPINSAYLASMLGRRLILSFFARSSAWSGCAGPRPQPRPGPHSCVSIPALVGSFHRAAPAVPTAHSRSAPVCHF